MLLRIGHHMTASLLPLLLFLSLFFFLQSPHNALATAGVGEQVSTPNEAAVPADIEVAASAAAEQILAQHGQAEAEQFHVVAPHTERVMSNQFLNLKRQTQNNENNQKIIQDIDVGTLVSPSVSNDQHRRKRVLVYCMQSSGCSIFMMVLGQKLRSLTIVDLYIVDPVPDVIDSQGSDDVDWYVLKMTFRGVERGGEQLDYKKHLDEIKAIYRPDISVLYMRHPGDNLISLRKHSDPKVPINYDHSDTCNTRQKPSWVSGYAYRCGDPESKLRNLEMMWSSRDAEFDAVFTYHDLHFGQQMLVDKMTSLGFEMQSDAFQLKRGIQEIMKFAHSNFKSSNKVRFGPGGIPNHAVGITKDGFHTYAPYTAEVTQIMQEQCPTVFAHFQSLEVPSKQH